MKSVSTSDTLPTIFHQVPNIVQRGPLEVAPLSRLQLAIALGMTLAAAATWMPALQYDFSGGCMDEKAENLWEVLQ